MKKLTVAALVAVGALGLAACDRDDDAQSNRVGQVRPGQASQDQSRQAARSPGSQRQGSPGQPAPTAPGEIPGTQANQSTSGANGPPTTGAGGPPSPAPPIGQAPDSAKDPRTAQVTFDAADIDKDGAVSSSEASAISVSDVEFSSADADHSSTLDRQEFAVALAGDRPRG
jgi:hypothetical protein